MILKTGHSFQAVKCFCQHLTTPHERLSSFSSICFQAKTKLLNYIASVFFKSIVISLRCFLAGSPSSCFVRVAITICFIQQDMRTNIQIFYWDKALFLKVSLYSALCTFVASTWMSVVWSLVSLLCSCLNFHISVLFCSLLIALCHIGAVWSCCWCRLLLRHFKSFSTG